MAFTLLKSHSGGARNTREVHSYQHLGLSDVTGVLPCWNETSSGKWLIYWIILRFIFPHPFLRILNQVHRDDQKNQTKTLGDITPDTNQRN